MGLLDNILGRQQAPSNMPGILAPQRGGILGISGPTLMALGAGIASGDGWGEGIGRGFGLASQVKEKERAREAQLDPLRMTYKALVDDGVTPQDALLQTVNPSVAKTRDERKRKSDWQKMILGNAPGSSVGNPSNGGMYSDAISSIESSGNYAAMGPVIKSGAYQGDRAYGKFQVMGKNIPSWTQEVLGRSMTPEEYLASPDAQNAVFEAKFGALAKKHGPEGAAKAWFAGEGGMNDGNRKDQLGTTVDAYGQKFMQALGPQPATGSMIDGLTSRQRTLVAAAGPEKGLALLAEFQSENAKTAKTEQDKAKSLNATKSVLASQFPDMAPEQIDAIARSGNASSFLNQVLKAPKGASTPLGKLKQDLVAGFISPEQYLLAAKKETSGSTKQMDEFGFPVGSSDSNQMKALTAQGVDKHTALGIVSGRYVVSVNPQTGERVLVDKAKRSIVPLSQPQPAQSSQSGAGAQPPAQTADAGRTLFEMAPDATGVLSTGAALLSDTIGQGPGAIGEAATFPNQVKAQTEFKLFTNDLIRSMSVNPRFPVAEMQRLMELVPRGAFTSETTLKQALTALDGELARMEERLSVSSRDPSVPVDVRNQDARSLGDVRAARKRIGIPKASGEIGKQSVTVGDKEIPWSIKK